MAKQWDNHELRIDNDRLLRFLDFHGGRDVEHMNGLLLEWLRCRCHGAGSLDVDPRVWTDKPEILIDALVDLARVYLAGWGQRPGVPMNAEGHRAGQTSEPCLFYRTWHSIAFSAPESERAIPVRLGEHWQATRGGWFWGILDTGSGREIAMRVLQFGLSEQMAVHKIAQRIYLPADEKFLDQNNGETSIFNTGLMREEYHRARSRTEIPGYQPAAPCLLTRRLSAWPSAAQTGCTGDAKWSPRRRPTRTLCHSPG